MRSKSGFDAIDCGETGAVMSVCGRRPKAGMMSEFSAVRRSTRDTTDLPPHVISPV
jgi:hypothetical protein